MQPANTWTSHYGKCAPQAGGAYFWPSTAFGKVWTRLLGRTWQTKTVFVRNSVRHTQALSASLLERTICFSSNVVARKYVGGNHSLCPRSLTYQLTRDVNLGLHTIVDSRRI
jgi:hypothetical protein